jgi:GNAT superfamily N-acetyltransferase
MTWYKKAQGSLSFENIHLDYHHGQNDFRLLAKIDDDPVGGIDYSEFKGSLHISYILVKPSRRRKGIATALVRELERLNETEFDGQPIRWGMMTPEGAALKESL